MNTKGFEFSFGWIFAILVGAAFISLAIYAATKFISSEGVLSGTLEGKEVSVLLTPLESDIEDGKVSFLSTRTKTVIETECDEKGTFGSQRIRLGTSLGKETTFGSSVRSSSQYFFSSSLEGKEFVVFSKPFMMPFRVADVLFLWSSDQKYCFVRTPPQISDELTSLNVRSISFASSLGGCPAGSTTVCFDGSRCSIMVDTQSKTVKSGNHQAVSYDDSFGSTLLYGAIFADPATYECQLARLMKRAGELSRIYAAKSTYLDGEGCSNHLQEDLLSYAAAIGNFSTSKDLGSIAFTARTLAQHHDDLLCKIF